MLPGIGAPVSQPPWVSTTAFSGASSLSHSMCSGTACSLLLAAAASVISRHESWPSPALPSSQPIPYPECLPSTG